MQTDRSLNVLESLNETMILRRRLEQVFKYRKAEPGIMQAARSSISSKGMGINAWVDLLSKYETIPTITIENMIRQIDNEVDYRLTRFYIKIQR